MSTAVDAYTFDIPGAPLDHWARAIALWDGAAHASIATPLDVDFDAATGALVRVRARFPRGDRVLGVMPRHNVRASLWLSDVVDAVREALAFGFSRFRAPELVCGRPSLVFGVDEEWAPPSPVGAKHRVVGELFGFPGHRVSRTALSLLPESVAAVAGSDSDDIDALSQSLASYLSSSEARSDARVDEFIANGAVLVRARLLERLVQEPELLAFQDAVDAVVRVHGHDLVMRVGEGAPCTELLARLPALDHELIAVVADADRGLAARKNAAVVLGRKRSRAAVPVLLSMLRDSHEPPLVHAALDALAHIPGERSVIVDDASGTLTPCPHDFHALMPLQAALPLAGDDPRRYCPDCDTLVTPARALRRRKLSFE